MPTAIDQLLIQSLQLLGLGMGSVFIILCLLIALISIVSRLVPEETPAPRPAPAPAKQGAPKIDSDHVAAIAAAIKQYRKNRK